MDYAAACKELKRVGTAHASGPALAAMYARLISYQSCLDGPKGQAWTTKNLYAYLCALPDDKAMHSSATELLSDPHKAADVAFEEASRVLTTSRRL